MSRALPRPAAAATALALGLALSGCGANFEAQNYQVRSSADAVNAAVGSIAIRNLAVQPGRDGELQAGDDAEALVTLVNRGGEDDRLVEVTSPAAASVDFVSADGGAAPSSVVVPRLGSTGQRVGLVLRDLDEDLRSGESVELTLRFERNGEVTLLAPVQVTQEYDDEREKSENFHPPGSEGEEGGSDTGGRGEGGETGGLRESGEETTSDTE